MNGGTAVTLTVGRRSKLSVLLAARHNGDLHLLLAREGFQVQIAEDGQTTLQLSRRHLPDMVIIDVCTVRLSGVDVCRQLRSDNRTADVPVVVVSEDADESKKVAALEVGADDYITKPFGERELVARVRAILRRSRKTVLQSHGEMQHADLAIDTVRHEVTYQQNPINLTATEFDLLRLLMSEPGRVFSRRQIGARIRDGFAEAADRTIDSHVKALRRKLGRGGAKIQTVRGIGYRLHTGHHVSHGPGVADAAGACDVR
jgi:DNA-binding response OmpR family regulator